MPIENIKYEIFAIFPFPSPGNMFSLLFMHIMPARSYYIKKKKLIHHSTRKAIFRSTNTRVSDRKIEDLADALQSKYDLE